MNGLAGRHGSGRRNIGRSGIQLSVEEACHLAHGTGSMDEDFASHFKAHQKANTLMSQ